MILEIKNLKKSFDRTGIINGVNLVVEEDECHSIIGPNGAGKSTLYNLITGLYPVDSGQIIFKGNNITNLNPYEIYRRGISRSFQITNLFQDLTVFENIRCSLFWTLGYKYCFWRSLNKLKSLNIMTDNILERIHLINKKNEIVNTLSYAEQRLLEIGMTFGNQADLVILDEPSAGLSKFEVEGVISLITQLKEKKTVVLVEHDMDIVFQISNRISVLVYGYIIATGTKEEIKNNRQVQESYLGNIKSD